MRYLLALLAVVHLSAFAASATPEAAAEAFYRWVLFHPEDQTRPFREICEQAKGSP
jgi:hypothetical protein